MGLTELAVALLGRLLVQATACRDSTDALESTRRSHDVNLSCGEEPKGSEEKGDEIHWKEDVEAKGVGDG